MRGIVSRNTSFTRSADLRIAVARIARYLEAFKSPALGNFKQVNHSR
jgi:hypothetical protein